MKKARSRFFALDFMWASPLYLMPFIKVKISIDRLTTSIPRAEYVRLYRENSTIDARWPPPRIMRALRCRLFPFWSIGAMSPLYFAFILLPNSYHIEADIAPASERHTSFPAPAFSKMPLYKLTAAGLSLPSGLPVLYTNICPFFSSSRR